MIEATLLVIVCALLLAFLGFSYLILQVFGELIRLGLHVVFRMLTFPFRCLAWLAGYRGK